MILLGINISHNSSACIMVDGKIQVAIQEERLEKKKNFTGYPKKSIEFCLNYLKEKNLIADVAILTTKFLPAFSYKFPIGNFFSIKEFKDFYGEKFYEKKLKNQSTASYLKKLFADKRAYNSTKFIDYKKYNLKNIFTNCIGEQLKYLKKQLGSLVKRIEIIDHHTCHAYYALYGLPFNQKKKIAIVTMDSWGDGSNQTLWTRDKMGKLKKIYSNDQCQLARIYKFVTLILSMKPDEHEFKVMGLAPYAKNKYAEEIYNNVFKKILKVKDCMIVHDAKPKNLYSYLVKNLRDHRFDNIAGAVQLFVEKTLTQLFYQISKKFSINYFCFSGGVSMNIKANKILSDLPFVNKLNVPPSGGDESLCIGGCYFFENKNSKPLDNIYLGQTLSGITLKDLVKFFPKKHFVIRNNFSHKKIALLLKRGNIIAVARDREEFGARALGNRSILANPSVNHIVEIINEKIKNRDFWMPFALTILKEYHKKYIKNNKNLNSEYMTIAMDTVQKRYDSIYAGTHQYDRTVRPQILSKSKNPNYYNIINQFKKITGIPALLNTSLNLHGLPIASNIKDISEVIINSDLRLLYLNDKYLVKKK
jgi:carbamoyltransferase